MSAEQAIVALSEIDTNHEGVCFAVLDRKDRKESSSGHFFICHFKDRSCKRTSPIFSSHRLFKDAEGWTDKQAYRLHCIAEKSNYGLQLRLIDVRPFTNEDAQGVDLSNLFEHSKYPVEESFGKILEILDRFVTDEMLKRLVTAILQENAELFKCIPAAENLHHPFTGGLVEHIRSVAHIAALLAKHYSQYYNELNPPLNIGLVVSAAILHDIGKIREFEFHPGGAKYTPAGRLVGHIVLGRDIVRDAAKQIDGFPEEMLLLLEHAILSHHGKPEYDSPKRPATLEALLVHYADEIDAKMNCGVRMLGEDSGDEWFTRKAFGWEETRIYKGMR